MVRNEAGKNASLSLLPSAPANAMKEEIKPQRQQRLEPDTARESASKTFRTQGWDAFSKNKPPFAAKSFADDLSNNPSQYGKTEKTEETISNTPYAKNVQNSGERSSKEEELFLNCFGGKEKQQGAKNGSALYDYEWSDPLKEKANENGAYLRIFGFRPIPDGPPVEWDLSKNTVLNQLQAYQETVERLRTPVPRIRTRTPHPQTEWYQRTVFLDNLPREVDPVSLRRAFETTFGEIEEDNGIILASARKSSIAYVVFKSFEAAMAVGRADTWVKGTKIVIQKYRPNEP